MSGRRILVTGGAGFLGSHLCDSLLDRGDEVVAVDNFLTGSPQNLAHLKGHERFRLLRRDIVEGVGVDGPVDCLLNLASPASPMDYLKLPLETLAVGAAGTLHCLRLAEEKGARFLQASTSECYGDPQEHPQKEDYWGHVNPVGPRAVYDEAKRYAEALTMAFHRSTGLDTRIARIFNTYGPRMKLSDGRVVPTLLEQALAGKPLTVFGDGSQTRSFCYISDLVEGIALLMDAPEQQASTSAGRPGKPGRLSPGLAPLHFPVNLGNPQEISIRRFADLILEVTAGRSPVEFRPLPEDDPRQRCPDITRARSLLGWEPRVTLEEGLRRTVEYFRRIMGQTSAGASRLTGTPGAGSGPAGRGSAGHGGRTEEVSGR